MDSYEDALVQFVEAFDRWRLTDEGLLSEVWSNDEYMVMIEARDQIDDVA